MTASDIERLETLQLLTETQMRRLREALFWLKRRQRTIPVANCEDSLDALAAVAVEQAEKLRRLENRDADADVLIATQKDIIAALEQRNAELEAKVERWKWCLRFLVDDTRAVDMYYTVPEARIGDTDDVIRCLLARYDAARKDAK